MRHEFAVVFPRAGPDGGVERMALELLRDQSRRRSTAFVGGALDAPDDIDHIRVATPRLPHALRPVAFRRLAGRALRREQPSTSLSFGVECPPGDVYWVQSVHAAWLATGGEVYVRGRRVPPALRRLKPAHRVLLGLEHDYFTRHRPRLILCTSPREVEDLHRFYGVDRSVTRVLPNCYDGTVFDPERAAAQRISGRHRMGAGPTDIVLLMIANEWHRKGLGVAVAALAALADPRVRLDLVGAPPPAAYQQLARQLGVADRMRWHGRSADVVPFLGAADVFVLPTTYEPFGLVIAEAMACGLPVVASRSAGAAAAITDGVTGMLLADPRDTDQLSGALTALLDPAARARIGAAGTAAVARFERRAVFAEFDRLVFGTSEPAEPAAPARPAAPAAPAHPIEPGEPTR